MRNGGRSIAGNGGNGGNLLSDTEARCSARMEYLRGRPMGENRTATKISQSPWISVKEQLPEAEGAVFVHIRTANPEKPITEKVWFEPGKGFHVQDFWQSSLTHWMPLPEPPKGESGTGWHGEVKDFEEGPHESAKGDGPPAPRPLEEFEVDIKRLDAQFDEALKSGTTQLTVERCKENLAMKIELPVNHELCLGCGMPSEHLIQVTDKLDHHDGGYCEKCCSENGWT